MMLTEDGVTYPAGILGVVSIPLTSASRFTAPNLTFSTFTYEQGDMSIVPYR